IDSAFNPAVNDSVNAIIVQPDGNIVIGGYFTAPRNRIARVKVDGSLDSAFNPDANDFAFAMATQADGKILVAGGFTGPNRGATARNRIARLNPDGSVDNAFDPNANDIVYGVAVQADGKILIGGAFTTLNGGAITRNHIARLNANGTIDMAFNPD